MPNRDVVPTPPMQRRPGRFLLPWIRHDILLSSSHRSPVENVLERNVVRHDPYRWTGTLVLRVDPVREALRRPKLAWLEQPSAPLDRHRRRVDVQLAVR